MTRPLAAGRNFVAMMPQRLATRLKVTETPLLRIEPTGNAVDMDAEDAAIFTSSNGVRYAPDGAGRAAFCVGAATTLAASDRGWAAVQMGETAEALTRKMAAIPHKQRLFHLSGTHIRGDVVAHLRGVGANAHRVAVYDQVTCDLTDAARTVLAGDMPVLVPLFSPRTATRFFGQSVDFKKVVVLGLSEAIADCAPDDLRAEVIVSSAPDVTAMMKALDQTVDRLASG